MDTAHELFIHDLKDMLNAERELVEALGKKAREASNSDLSKAFANHQKQTEEQVSRLEEVFESINEQPEEQECKGIKGLIEESESLKEENPSPDLLDVANIGAATKVERYEISAYESLIRLADMMGHSQASRLLKRTLREEEQTLNKLQTLSRKVKPENMGMEAEEEEQPRRTRRRGRRAA